ncbi:histidine kinase [soil metagenome]
MNNKANLLLIHILGSAIFLALPVIFSPDLSTDFDFIFARGFQRDFLFSIFLILFFYLSHFYLIPQLYFKQKYFIFFAIAIISFIVVLCLPLFILPPSQFNLVQSSETQGAWHFPHIDAFVIRELRSRLFQFLIVFIFSLMLKINNQWKQSEKEKLDAELSYLKAQINPHFLFNTLNSIYSLAIVKSDNVASSIVKLSNMMRYVLSESSNNLVRLEKEIEYIQNYIELQQIRFGTFIEFECSINGDPKNKMISPLILIPFIENAYKHGVNAEDNSIIKIKIDISDDQLFLMVKNNKVFVQRSEESKSGLGVENTKNRLHHIYPGKHTLVINDTEKEYSVSLTINLK